MGLVVSVLVAVVAGWVIFKVGFAVLGSFARPVPEPPPAGEMRKVKLRYRCSLCGMELRTERAATEEPDPPRHCMEEMDLLAPID